MPNDSATRQTGPGSQDAVRHEKDAQHHKFRSGSQPSEPVGKNDRQSPQSEEQQPEIPKVGSRDAPGG